jgi:hypothetical protein
MVKVERILVVTTHPPPTNALTWLLRSNIKVTGSTGAVLVGYTVGLGLGHEVARNNLAITEYV